MIRPQPVPAAASPARRLWALVPCAGSGSRAGTGVAKQYRLLLGRPLVLHTLAALGAVRRIAHCLVVVSPGDCVLEQAAADSAGAWSIAACGGDTRAQSVAGGLAHLSTLGAQADDWVLVHDAARCLVTPQLVDRLIDACLADPVGGLLAQPVADTLKRVQDGRVAGTPDRNQHWLAQTPQMFRLGQLARALQAAGPAATDEASAIEQLGLAPQVVPGAASNFKVTFAEDLVLAEATLQHRLVQGDKP